MSAFANSNPKLRQLSTAVRLMEPCAQWDSELDQTSALRTERLCIRPLFESDREEFVRVVRLSREHLAVSMPLHIPGEDDRSLFARQLRQREAGDATRRDWRRVFFDGSGRLVGGINFNDIRCGLENRSELTVWVGADQAGRGYALEALGAAISVAFAPAPLWSSGRRQIERPHVAPQRGGPKMGLGLDRLSALVACGNEPCLRLIRRLGFNPIREADPIQITIGDRRVEHLEWRLWARVAVMEAKPIHAYPARVGESIRAIEAVERSAEHRRF